MEQNTAGSRGQRASPANSNSKSVSDYLAALYLSVRLMDLKEQHKKITTETHLRLDIKLWLMELDTVPQDL